MTPLDPPRRNARGQESRAWLVDQLLLANPKLTDRKLLLRLGRSKLASMLIDAQDSAPRRGAERCLVIVTRIQLYCDSPDHVSHFSQ